MKLNMLILAAAITLGFGLTHLFGALKPAAEQVAVPEPVAANACYAALPAFDMTTLGGATHNSKDFRGKYVMVNFWASWCPPCVAEFPMLLELAALYPDNLVLLAVSSDREKAAIDKFMKALDEKSRTRLAQDNVLIIHDANSFITFDTFQTVKLPETVIAGPDGTMLKKLVGVDWTVEDVQALMKDKP